MSKGAVSEGANENVDFDANGKRKRRDSDFVAYNHKPEEIVDKSMVAAAAIKASLKSGDAKSGMAGGSAAGGGATGGGGAVGGDGGGKAPNAGSGKGKPAQPQQAQQPKKPQQAQPQQPPKPKPQPQPQQTQQPQQQERIEMAHLPADVSIIKARFKNRKFLLPLLDQGPNNQFLQMRVALAKAHSMNRTLVLPVWLPHNPKFQHFHPGAPNVPSRDKKLDAISHPFESTFDPELLSRFVRTIDLAAFRLLTGVTARTCLTWRVKQALSRTIGRSLSCNPAKCLRKLPPAVYGARFGGLKTRNRVSAIFMGNKSTAGYATLLAWLLYAVFGISFNANLAASVEQLDSRVGAGDAFANLLGHFGQFTNIISFLVSFFGFSYMMEVVGV